jgi:hypothetical protein
VWFLKIIGHPKDMQMSANDPTGISKKLFSKGVRKIDYEIFLILKWNTLRISGWLVSKDPI